MSKVEARLAELGVILPDAAAPVANYAPFVQAASLLFVSGQVSIGSEGLITGRAGDDASLERAVTAAHACAVNLLAQVKAACGDLDRVVRVVKLTGFVNCTADFKDHPKVINGASDLMVAAFGDRGRHARAAVGAPSLPMNALAEVDGVFEIA